MKIALAAPYPYNPDKIPGGVAYVSYVLAKGFEAREDIDLHIVSLTKETAKYETKKNGRIAAHFIPESRRRIVPNMFQSVGKVERELRRIQPDVVYSHSSVATLGSLNAGLPTVHCVHGIAKEEARVAKGVNKINLLLKLVIENKAVARSKYLVAISSHTEQAFQGIAKHKFHRIDNPVEDEYFALEGVGEPGHVLFVGSLGRRKNLLGLLSVIEIASKRVPELTLVVAGGTSDKAYADEVENFIAERNLSKNVQLLGLVKRQDLPAELAKCSVYALISREENAPCAITQAMAAGKPVLASNVGGIPDMVEHGKMGYLADCDDTEKLAEYLITLLEDDNLRRSMGEAARVEANKRFRKEIAVARALDVCREAIADHETLRG